MRRFHATGTVREHHHESNVWAAPGRYGARYVHAGERVTVLVEAANEGSARVVAHYDRKLRGDLTVHEVAR